MENRDMFEFDVEFLGSLDDVTQGPHGPTQDTLIGDYDSL